MDHRRNDRQRMDAMTRVKPFRVLLSSVILAALCAACSSNTSCGELTAPKLLELFAISGDDSVARGRIGELFGLQPSEVTTSRVVGGYYYYWGIGNRRFTWLGGQTRLEVKWSAAPPTLGRVLQCLGDPDHYQAETLPTPDGPPYHHLSLWYESRAMAAIVDVYGLPWGYSELQATDRLVYVAGGTWQERLESANSLGSFPVMRSVGSLRAWPGSISKIVVGNDPWLR